jgi:hypothetical protein
MMLVLNWTSCPNKDHVKDSKLCLNCINDYSYFYNNQCVKISECPNLEHIKTSNKCLLCQGETDHFYNDTCLAISNCPNIEHVTAKKTCKLCVDNENYFYNNSCVNISQCPNNKHVTDLKLCKLCTGETNYFIENNCIKLTDCPNTDHIIESSRICLRCVQPRQYFFIDECVELSQCHNPNNVTNTLVCKRCEYPNDHFYVDSCISLNNCPSIYHVTNTKICKNCILEEDHFYNNKCTNKIQCPSIFHIDSKKRCYDCLSQNKVFDNENCSDKCDDLKEYINENKVCVLCPDSKKIINEEQCINECPFTHYHDTFTNRCLKCLIDDQVIYNNECVNECPERHYIKEKTCFYCEEYFVEETKSCTSECGLKQIVNDLMKTCITCKEPNKFYDPLINQCVSQCPLNFGGIESDNFLCKNIEGLYYYDKIKSYVNKCPNDLYASEDLRKCIKCEEVNLIEIIDSKGTYSCTSECPEFYILVANKCVNCPSKLITYNPEFKCLTTCPEGQIETLSSDKKNSICEKCEFYVIVNNKTECISMCEKGYVSNSIGKCITCKESGMFTFNDICVNKCNLGQIVNKNNECIDFVEPDEEDNKENQTTKQTSGCDISTCNFNGMCSIINGERKCECIDSYVEYFCKYTDLEIRKLIDENLELLKQLEFENNNAMEIKLLQNMNILKEVNTQLFSNYNEMVDKMTTFAEKQLESMINNGSLDTEVLDLVDSTINTSQNKKNTVDLIKNLSNSESLRNSKGLKFSGENFSLSSLDNSEDSLKLSLKNNIPIIDTTECEKTLKSMGLLNEDDKLYSVSLRMNPSLLDLGNATQEYVKAKYVNGVGDTVDTSKCTNIVVKLPTKNIGIDIKKYNELKSRGFDLLDSNDDFFNNLCISFESDNGADITLNKRREMFNIGATCAEGCKYSGIDENNYTICNCSSNISEITNKIEDKTYSFAINSNIGIIKCYKRALENVKVNLSFYVFLSITIFSLFVTSIYMYFYDYKQFIENNFDKLVDNDFKEKYLPNIDYKEYLIDKSTNLKYLDKNNVEVPLLVGSGNLNNHNDINKNADHNINNMNEENNSIVSKNASSTSLNQSSKLFNQKDNELKISKLAVCKIKNLKFARIKKITKIIRKLLEKEKKKLMYLYFTDISNNPLLNLNMKNAKKQKIHLHNFMFTKLFEFTRYLNSLSLFSIKHMISYQKRNFIFIKNSQSSLKNYVTRNTYISENYLKVLFKNNNNNNNNENIDEEDLNKLLSSDKVIILEDEIASKDIESSRILDNQLKINEIIDFKSHKHESKSNKFVKSKSTFSNNTSLDSNIILKDEFNKNNSSFYSKFRPISKSQFLNKNIKNQSIEYLKVKQSDNDEMEIDIKKREKSYEIKFDNDLDYAINLSSKDKIRKLKFKRSTFLIRLCHKNLIKYLKRKEFLKVTGQEVKSDYQLLITGQETYFEYFINQMVENHPILNLLFYKSLLMPFFIRFLDFMLEISLVLFFNAVFFDDTMIDQRSNTDNDKKTPIGIVIYQNASKALISAIIPTILKFFLSFLYSPLKKFKTDISRQLAKNNKSLLKFT